MDPCNHSPNDGPVCLTCLDALEDERDKYRAALEEIRQLVHPKGTEQRLEGCAGCRAEKALGSTETKNEQH